MSSNDANLRRYELVRCYVELETKNSEAVNLDTLSSAISSALTQLFGLVGGAISFNLKSCSEKDVKFEIEVDRRDFHKLQMASTLITHIEGSQS